MENYERPIGFFDSGVGGLSVLKEAVKLLPNENYIYYGDSKNAPYGTKDYKEVQQLTLMASKKLIDKGVKAIVIACNTATSAGVDKVRETYKIPIIGIEPALKPAVELNRMGKIVIMATPMTLAEKKFKSLMEHYNKKVEIYSLPCPGLVEFIEKGIIDGDEIEGYIKNIFSDINLAEIAAVVLGCTHYPFVRDQMSKYLGGNIPIIDGSVGTSNHLKKRLEEENLLNISNKKGNLEIINSLDNNEIISLSHKLLEL
jgi:glutamate racemase